MRCKRCHGLVVAEGLMSSPRNERLSDYRGWRCVNCGELLDIGILRNRAWRRARPSEASAAFPGDARPLHSKLRQEFIMNDRLIVRSSE